MTYGELLAHLLEMNVYELQLPVVFQDKDDYIHYVTDIDYKKENGKLIKGHPFLWELKI